MVAARRALCQCAHESSNIAGMTAVGVRELSHHTSRYLAQVRAGQAIDITDRGHVIAVITPVGHADHRRRRPRIGGYRSTEPWTAEQVDAELAGAFGSDAAR